uniref:BCAS3 n=1 Tax=Ascaris lumbricoides TaxID=6252 RepID=A0A0M3I1J9_ASCLU
MMNYTPAGVRDPFAPVNASAEGMLELSESSAWSEEVPKSEGPSVRGRLESTSFCYENFHIVRDTVLYRGTPQQE